MRLCVNPSDRDGVTPESWTVCVLLHPHSALMTCMRASMHSHNCPGTQQPSCQPPPTQLATTLAKLVAARMIYRLPPAYLPRSCAACAARAKSIKNCCGNADNRASTQPRTLCVDDLPEESIETKLYFPLPPCDSAQCRQSCCCCHPPQKPHPIKFTCAGAI